MQVSKHAETILNSLQYSRLLFLDIHWRKFHRWLGRSSKTEASSVADQLAAHSSFSRRFEERWLETKIEAAFINSYKQFII